ncbi:MAG: PEGA domain-containing protein [Methanoregula sp.]|nr:PEGA domain-containing protein [Methanoregula sp.]
MIPSTSSPTISSISPSSAANSGSQTIEIVGTGFSGSTVTLTQSGLTAVVSTVTGTDTVTSLSRIFNLNGIASGTWNVVILNSDGGTVTGTFTVNSATTATVTSISPTSGTVNTSVSTTVAGTGFVPSSAKIRLYRSGNYIGGSVNSGGTATQLTGTFNLNQATPGAYEVCVLPDGTETSKICGPTFTILSTSAANGTINLKSSPSISKIFLNNVFQGYTPMTLENITPTTYTVMIRSAGYNDYSERVSVTAGNTSYVTASLVLAPEETTVTTTAPQTTVTTVRTTAMSTVKVPTPWPTDTPTPASPVSILVILGAVGVGFIVLRKH